MKSAKLLSGLEVVGDIGSKVITGISSDSRKTKKGDLFIAIRGERHDGHNFVREAVARGAAAVLAEQAVDGVSADVQLITRDTRLADSVVWNNFLGDPSHGMTKIAVTGTAGKTTTALLLGHIMKCAGHRVGIVSTVGTFANGEKLYMGENGGSSVSDIAGAMTTPDPEYFFTALSEMKHRGCDVLIYEASSQSLELKKTSAVIPDIAIYTNISPEHLDSHGSMESYFAAKSSLLCGVKRAVINADCELFMRLPTLYPETSFVLCSTEAGRVAERDVCALRYTSRGAEGIEYVYFSEDAVFRMLSPLIGEFNVQNTLLAAACAVTLGEDVLTVRDAAASFAGVYGRMTRVTPSGVPNCPEIFIDYAHTAESLSGALASLRAITHGKLTVVFGCGGERDREKRPHMARAAQRWADRVVITGDNPRNESPERIFKDILSGIDPMKNHTVIEDRRAAIRYAMSISGEGDTVLLAGKGHEKYEIRGDGTHPFDEEAIVLSAAAEKYQ